MENQDINFLSSFDCDLKCRRALWVDGSHSLALVWKRGNWAVRDDSPSVRGATVDGSWRIG